MYDTWFRWGLIVVSAATSGCGAPAPFTTTGSTMGTSYHVVAYCAKAANDLAQRIDATLAEVNAEMSTYDPDSVLSRFNSGPVGDWFPVSPAMVEVVEFAQSLARRSGGAFDVTVGPLVNLYGFGPDAATATPPDAEAIARAQAQVGFEFLEVRSNPPALRRSRNLYVDLSAVAKGYGVDAVSKTLAAAGCAQHMVEIGGEVFAAGRKPDGAAWRIGIEVPDSIPGTEVGRVVRLENAAVATSGDYRNFIEYNGTRISHTFDGRTGAPVTHHLASVTVIQPTTLQADGFATLLEVLGPVAGPEFANSTGLAALFIERTEHGFVTNATADMAAYLERETK